jgi:UDP-N-acetylmuramate--alanine ligase
MKKNSENGNSKIVYFIGIGGIGMSALARFYLTQGYAVYGYDLTKTPLTEMLSKEGMKINFDDSLEVIPKEIIADKNATIIYTPAIPSDHTGLNYFKNNGYILKKRAEVLGDLTTNFKTIAIAGTHGKTTTTAIAAHILNNSSLATVSFIGGVLAGYESNILLNENPEWILVEADEFDRSFLQLNPEILGITSVDADHLDVYEDEISLTLSFKELCEKIPMKNKVFVCDRVKADLCMDEIRYGFSDFAEIQIKSEGYYAGNHRIKVTGLVNNPVILEVPMPGDHNALNAVLAASVCLKAGCEIDLIIENIKTFKGVKRRFEYIIDNEKMVFIDDYAHHPKEIDALIDAVHALYPNKKITGIFQPHLYSRTRDFADEFAISLSKLDQLYLLDIYPAREKPIHGIDAEMLLEKITLNEKSIVNKDNLPVLINSTIPEILLTIGAGDIAQVVPAVKQAIISSIGYNE